MSAPLTAKPAGCPPDGLRNWEVGKLKDNQLQMHTQFVLELLSRLKDVYEQLTQSSSGLEQASGSVHEKLVRENMTSVQKDIDSYNSNIEKIRQLRFQITESINAWYMFSNDACQMKRLSFPVLFLYKKGKLKNSIKKANEMISAQIIENRFIKEKLSDWEHQIGLKAVQEIKGSSDYNRYELLQNEKDMLISDLKYLLPGIPGICPIQFDLAGINEVINEINAV
jgi:hypothetical protein